MDFISSYFHTGTGICPSFSLFFEKLTKVASTFFFHKDFVNTGTGIMTPLLFSCTKGRPFCREPHFFLTKNSAKINN